MKNDIKILAFSAIIILIIIFSGQLIKSYLEHSTNDLLSRIDSIEGQITTGSWEKASSQILSMDKDWSETEGLWAVFTNHHEIDNITVSLKSALEYIEQKDSVEALSSLTVLKHYIRHIPEMESLSLKNIF